MIFYSTEKNRLKYILLEKSKNGYFNVSYKILFVRIIIKYLLKFLLNLILQDWVKAFKNNSIIVEKIYSLFCIIFSLKEHENKIVI